MLDPIIISILALTVSICGTIWTIHSSREQNRRWDALHLGRLSLNDVEFVVWHELTEEEIGSTKWGYSPDIIKLISEKGVYKGKYHVMCELFLFSKSQNAKLPKSNGFMTASDASKEIQRLKGHSIQIDVNDLEIRRQYLVVFDVKNIGSTDVTNFNVEVDVDGLSGKQGSKETFIRRQTAILISPGKSFYLNGDFYTPLEFQLPERFSFTLNGNYCDSNGEEKPFNVEITRDGTAWRYEKQL
jgi:hypothetical protein